MKAKRREVDLGGPAFAVAVIEEEAGRRVVDDAIAGIVRMLAFEEGCGRQHRSRCACAGEEGVVEVDRVGRDREVGDLVDVGRGVQRRVKPELISGRSPVSVSFPRPP